MVRDLPNAPVVTQTGTDIILIAQIKCSSEVASVRYLPMTPHVMRRA